MLVSDLILTIVFGAGFAAAMFASEDKIQEWGQSKQNTTLNWRG